jgi:hypothetical protein
VIHSSGIEFSFVLVWSMMIACTWVPLSDSTDFVHPDEKATAISIKAGKLFNSLFVIRIRNYRVKNYRQEYQFNDCFNT